MIERSKWSVRTKICNVYISSEGRIEKSLVEEDIRQSKDLGGSARQCYIARKIWFKRLKDIFLEGSCLGSLGADLAPPNIAV